MTVILDDVATALGRAIPSGAEAAQWEMWIGDAVLLITAEATRRGATFSALDQSIVDYVVREAVVAQVKRPDDATTVDIAVDDGREARTYKSGRGRVTILTEWWDLLFPTASKSKAFAIDSVPNATVHLDWCALSLGATYCSCGADIAGTPIYEDSW